MGFRKSSRGILPFVVFALLISCAGMNSASPSYKQQEATEARLKQLEAQNKSLTQQVAALQSSVQSLNERVEALRTRMEAAKKARAPIVIHKAKHHKIRKPKRVVHKRPRPQKKTVLNRPPAPAPKAGMAPLSLYHEAYRKYAAGKFKEAARDFLEFVKQYPTHPYANNALYWTGESYYSLGDYNKAALYFNEVVEKYPKGSKVPDAMLKLGYTYAELGQKKKARAYLFNLMDKYPFSEAAQKAQSKLDELY